MDPSHGLMFPIPVISGPNPEILWPEDDEERGEPVRGANDGNHSDRDAKGRSGTCEDAMQVIPVRREDNPEDAMQVIPVSWEDNPEDVDPSREVNEGLEGPSQSFVTNPENVYYTDILP